MPPPKGRFSFESLPPATPAVGRRAAAFVVDGVLLMVVTGVLVLAAVVARLMSPVSLGPEQLGQVLTPVRLLAVPVFLLYFTLFEGFWGSTLGKATMGLRVVRLDGARCGMLDSFVRNLLRLLWGPGLALAAFMVVGNLTRLWRGDAMVADPIALVALAFLAMDLWLIRSTEMDQRLGDLAAGTTVVEVVRAPAEGPAAAGGRVGAGGEAQPRAAARSDPDAN